MKPNFDYLPEFYHDYVHKISEPDVSNALTNSGEQCLTLFRSISEEKSAFRYADGKWSIKELVSHVIDAERVFAYRALSFARNDNNSLPGFEENEWAASSKADNRTFEEIINEYDHVRKATIDLFASFDEEMLVRTGTASGGLFNVANLGYVIAGHETHHRNILNERYLKS